MRPDAPRRAELAMAAAQSAVTVLEGCTPSKRFNAANTEAALARARQTLVQAQRRYRQMVADQREATERLREAIERNSPF